MDRRAVAAGKTQTDAISRPPQRPIVWGSLENRTVPCFYSINLYTADMYIHGHTHTHTSALLYIDPGPLNPAPPHALHPSTPHTHPHIHTHTHPHAHLCVCIQSVGNVYSVHLSTQYIQTYNSQTLTALPHCAHKTRSSTYEKKAHTLMQKHKRACTHTYNIQQRSGSSAVFSS